jgi:glycosyltransferase involved in cell wall biosynthesis
MNLSCSVVIQVYNGEHTLLHCLDALAQQTTPPALFEIIVVDDGSRDRTVPLLLRWAHTHPHDA